MMTTSNRIKLGNWLRNHPSLLPVAKKLNRVVYTTTGSSHILPDFLIIGAARSGTTSLYEYLIQHPSIIPGVGKEVYFFDKKFLIMLNVLGTTLQNKTFSILFN